MKPTLLIENGVLNFEYKGLYHRNSGGSLEMPLQKIKSEVSHFGLEVGPIISMGEDKAVKQAIDASGREKRPLFDQEMIRAFSFNPLASITITRQDSKKHGSIILDSFNKTGSERLLEDLARITNYKIKEMEQSIIEGVTHSVSIFIPLVYQQSVDMAKGLGIRDLNIAYGLKSYADFLNIITDMSYEECAARSLLKFKSKIK